MGYEIDFPSAEKVSCSFRLIVADRVIIYVKNFVSKPTRYFAGEKDGTINKEITRAELDTWLNILADNENEVFEIQSKLGSGKKY
jgi:hypothetical protein